MNPRTASVNKLVDHLFRHNSGQMVSVLTAIFGFQYIDLIEDAIQESLLKALRQWQFKGVPDNPSAWMTQVAKNHILDQLRKEKRNDPSSEETIRKLELVSDENIEDKLRYPKEMDEDLLRLMFATCHSVLNPDSQVALTLKIVSGFSVAEIAGAFLSRKGAVAKMITRAKKKLKDHRVKLLLPPPDELNARIDAVIKILYLMFNEGYSPSGGKKLVRRDLCFEAIRLAQKLSDHPVTSSPKVDALLALFFFQAARLETRFNEAMDFLPLAEQQRDKWDKKLVNVGLYHFKRSARGKEISNYHLEAEIASYHIFAEDFDSTDWKRILNCYDELLRRKFSPVAALNRIIVLSKVEGAKIALGELDKLKRSKKLKDYFPMYIATAQLQVENKMFETARQTFQKALVKTENESIKRFLRKQIEGLKYSM
jgi:RNA polymerase sigma-70 factor (ECF subfamily)